MSIETKTELKDNFHGDDWVLSTDIRLVDKAGEVFGEKLAQAGWQDHADFEWFKTGFREALINAIVHGNLEIKNKLEGENWQEAALRVQEESPTQKKVYVSLDIKPDSIIVTIRDEGNGFTTQDLTDPTSEEGVLKPSGRGFTFMKNFFDEVRHNDIGNEVTMIKRRLALSVL